MVHLRTSLSLAILAGALSACPPPPAGPDTDSDVDTDTDTDSDTEPLPQSVRRTVRVTLDGAPAPDVVVVQGGTDVLYRTGEDGAVDMEIDLTVWGEFAVVASHPGARQTFAMVDPADDAELLIELVSYDTTDNPEYVFQDPGTPDRRDTTLQCAHCHRTLDDDWYASPHRTAASNAHVQELYAGTVAAGTQAACESLGGTWAQGLQPGAATATDRCYLGAGTLPDLDPSCAPNCDGSTEVNGQCADCHAPGIDGQLGDRDLLEATGFAYEAGVHCDVCHKVDFVDLDDPAPGVAGKLVVHRPSEPDDFPIAGPWIPLTFGPSHDSPNPRMGGVQRDHYKTGQICAGCHEHAQEVLVPGESADPVRWPDGRLPVHTTWTEWKQGPFGDKVPCNACHMPPAPGELNGSNLQDFLDALDPGVTGGWVRPAGAVRHHSWIGPRTESSRMLQLAAAVDLQTTLANGLFTVTATVQNVGAGHRIPTGEPGRQLVLHVAASCDDTALEPIGGDAIPPWVGAFASKNASGDWTRWPGAEVGQTVRVLTRAGWRDDPGYGPFGDGTFIGRDAGNGRWEVRGVRTITAVDGDVVTLDGELPSGTLALLGPPLEPPGGEAGPVAGAPGHAFGRVLVDADNTSGAPHHRAVDVQLDNRLAPYESVTTNHEFQADCEAPVARAWLGWRAQPWWLAREKSWSNPEKIMVEVSR